ncbi:MAG: hypothetical protein J3R72DRAFT_435603 [Linnemannia gamsii]|nr:MAG: hypothetical protein J3R72DRAFT_435603 [Linnemannia gamsii]
MDIQQEQHSPPARDLPTELIVAFGHCLDGHSLAASLRVCHHWYNALIPVVWHSITRPQWQHSNFPIHQPTGLQQQQREQDCYTGELPPTLVHVRQLEWCCNMSEQGEDRVSFTGTRLNALTTTTLARILQSTPNLVSLSLTIKVYFPDIAHAQALLQLKRLKRLVYDRSYSLREVNPTPLQDLFPLFSQLDELAIPSSAWTRNEREELEESGGFLLPAGQNPWRFKRLEAARGNLALLGLCSDRTMKELIIYREYVVVNSKELSHSFLPILRFSHLESIRIAIDQAPGQQEDVVLVLSALRRVRELFLEVFTIEALDFLNLPPTTVVSARQTPMVPEEWRRQDVRKEDSGQGQGNIEDGGDVDDDGLMVLPRLEDLTIHFIRPLVVESRSIIFRRLVMTRPRLKTFVVTNHDVNPDILFEESRTRSESDGWVCKDLETLNLCFPKSIYSKTPEGLDSIWRLIYGQISKLRKLKVLSLRCVGLQRTINGGINLLAGASCLQELTMIDVRFLKWTEEEVELLLPFVPRLRTFSLGPLRDDAFLDVASWLVDHGRPDVRLVR